MKRTTQATLIATALLSLCASAQAQVILTGWLQDTSAGTASDTWTVTNLDQTDPTFTSAGFAGTDGIGTFTNAAGLSGATLTIDVDARTGWSPAGAASNVATFDDWITNTLTDEVLRVAAVSRMGVGTDGFITDDNGDALFFTFTTTDIDNVGSQLQLTSINFQNFTPNSVDAADIYVWDSATQTFSFSEVAFAAADPYVFATPIDLNAGDYLVIGASLFGNNSWRLEGLGFDVVVIPEPSAFGFFGSVALISLLRRRRNG